MASIYSDSMSDRKIYIDPLYTKILFVEQGSIDTDAHQKALEIMGIKVIEYRQGAPKPELVNL